MNELVGKVKKPPVVRLFLFALFGHTPQNCLIIISNKPARYLIAQLLFDVYSNELLFGLSYWLNIPGLAPMCHL